MSVNQPIRSAWASFKRRGLAPVVLGGLAVAPLAYLLADDGPGSVSPAGIEALEEDAWRSAVKKISPSVVRIETLGGEASVAGKDDFTTAPTTGIVVDESGLILTSALKFANAPPSILVTLPGGEKKAAELVARDRSRELVLLRVKTDQKLIVPEMVSRDSLRIGQSVIAVGMTLEPDQPTMSLGIISAKDRVFGRAIQTDAKISPLNYGGPLIDLQGRVVGILSPLAAQGGEGGQTGADWYDIGLGFAVPLDEIKARLPVLERGVDLMPGLLGISLSRGDMYSLPAEIIGCRLDGPAGKAGLRAKDVIVEVDGQPIVRQAQLKHAVGKKYAGEAIQVVVKRGEERIEKSLVLVDKIEPYDHPFLGILPIRGKREGGGVEVRYVYKASPAANTGIEARDVILSCKGEKLQSAEQLYQLLAPLAQKEELTLEVLRGQETKQIKVVVGSLPTDVPEVLPPPVLPAVAPGEKPATGVLELKIPQQQTTGQVLVPQGYDGQSPQGLVVWFYAAGEATPEKIQSHFGDFAAKHHCLVLAAPMSGGDKWVPDDLELVSRFVDAVEKEYNIDKARVVTYGRGSEGAAASAAYVRAYLDQVHGMVLIDSPSMRFTQIVSSDQALRLAVFLANSKEVKAQQAQAANLKLLQGAKLPVTVLEKGESKDGDLQGSDLDTLGRWIDSLDRL